MISPNLLSIKRIPIDIEVNVQKPELRPLGSTDKNTPKISVSHNNDAFRLQAEPLQVDISGLSQRRFDSYSTSSSEKDGIKLTYKGYAKVNSDDGNADSNKVKYPIKSKKAYRSIESILESLPKTKNKSGVSWDNGKLSIDYKLDDDSDFLDMTEPKFEFVPGKIEFIINQMPGLEIEYLGEPIYFPRSADPNYEPPMDIFV